jgi:hypothetical protein
MDKRAGWARTLVIVGLALMVIGLIDPLEGSMIIFPGIAIVTAGAFLGKAQRRKLLLGAFGLAAAGIAAMGILSSKGGFGGTTGLSVWWASTMLPYPVGWFISLVAGIRTVGEFKKRPLLEK